MSKLSSILQTSIEEPRAGIASLLKNHQMQNAKSVWAYYLIAKAIKVFACLWHLSKTLRIQSEFQKQNKALNMLFKEVRKETTFLSSQIKKSPTPTAHAETWRQK